MSPPAKLKRGFLLLVSVILVFQVKLCIADRLLGLLESWQLLVSNMVGQAYDGAGSMAGKHKRAASHISKQHPKTTYTNCTAHVCT